MELCANELGRFCMTAASKAWPDRRARDRARHGSARASSARETLACCSMVAACFAAALGVGAVTVAAQDVASGSIVGSVIDSTAAGPLGGAIVAVLGTNLETTTDSDGQFEIAGVPAGEHQITVFHLRLQVLGASLPLEVVEVGAGATTTVELAVPSRETLLRAWCGAEGRSVSGVVRDVLTQNPISGVTVLVFRSRRRGPPEPAETDESGEFRYCGGPIDEGLELQAVWGETTGRLISVPAGDGPYPQDLYLELTEPVTLAVRLIDVVDGSGVAGATVQILGSQVRGVTDDAGRLQLRGIAAGTIALATEHVAYDARSDSLFAESGQFLEVELPLVQGAVALDPIIVVGESSARAEAARAGFRYDGMTRAMVDAVIHRTATFATLLRAANVPGLRIAETADGQLCVETLRRGGADCSMVEVILNGVLLLEAGRTLATLDPVTIDRFQFIPPIEARTRFQGGNVGNGVLLLYTR